jgi:SNF2 family DNA or RNA helicase
VLFDPWWNPAVEAQAIDRTHRIGQLQNVTAYRLIAENTIEEKIRSLQKQKSSLSNAVIGDEDFARALSLADLREIFSD